MTRRKGVPGGNPAASPHVVRAAPLPHAAAEDSVQEDRQDFPLVIASMPATKRQRTAAVGIVIFLIVAAAVIAPFASIQLVRVDAFIPVLQTVVSAADLITAVLLFAQFSIQPQLSLLALASGYVFSGSFAFLQTLESWMGSLANMLRLLATAPGATAWSAGAVFGLPVVNVVSVDGLRRKKWIRPRHQRRYPS
jgi:hypothetical protein